MAPEAVVSSMKSFVSNEYRLELGGALFNYFDGHGGLKERNVCQTTALWEASGKDQKLSSNIPIHPANKSQSIQENRDKNTDKVFYSEVQRRLDASTHDF